MMRNTVPKRLFSSFINHIKKGETGDECGLSLLMNLPEYWEPDGHLPDEFWEQDCQGLIDAYHKNKDWNDVLAFALRKE